MANTKHEDTVMKMGFDYFRDTIPKTLGIDYQYEEIGEYFAAECVQQEYESVCQQS